MTLTSNKVKIQTLVESLRKEDPKLADILTQLNKSVDELISELKQFSPTSKITSSVSPIWGEWRTPGVVLPASIPWDNEVHGDASYFNRISGNTQIEILVSGYYEILAVINTVSADQGGGSQESFTSLFVGGVEVGIDHTGIVSGASVPIDSVHTLHTIAFIPASTVIEISGVGAQIQGSGLPTLVTNLTILRL